MANAVLPPGLAPSAYAVLEQLAHLPSPDFATLSGAAARQYIADSRAATAAPKRGELVGSVIDLVIGESGKLSRLYAPADLDAPAPVLVFFHGGGWVTGSVEMMDDACRYVANRAQSVVLSVAYRFAPEHRFPAAANDAYDALLWAVQNIERFGGDPHRIAVAGTSAGGNLAAVACLRARDEGGPKVAEQILLYPVTDARMQSESYKQLATGYNLTAVQMQWFWHQYAPSEDERRNPYASPLLAASHADLPPALVITAEFDPLRDEGEQYAEAMSAAGVKTEVVRVPGQLHSFMGMMAVCPEATECWDLVADHLRALPA